MKYQGCVVRVVTTPKEALSVHVLKVTSWILMAENAVRKVVVKIVFLTCKATVIILPIFIVTFVPASMISKKVQRKSVSVLLHYAFYFSCKPIGSLSFRQLEVHSTSLLEPATN